MLHGSPATIVLGNGGIKMAGGRPGKEIGEGEQKFLKGWVEKEKARGMVDMVTFRFGDYTEESKVDTAGKRGEGQGGYWFWGNSAKASFAAAMSTSAPKGRAKGPGLIMPQDGCIFPGTGALETHSVRDISTYISELYQHGDETSTRTSGWGKHRGHRKRPKGLSKTGSLDIDGENSSVEASPRQSSSTIRPTMEEIGATPPPTGSKLKSSIDTNVAEVAAGEYSKSKNPSSTNAKILNLLTFGWSSSTKSNQTENTTATSAASTITSLPNLKATPLPVASVKPMAEQADGPDDPRLTQAELDDKKKNKRARFVIGFLGDLYVEDLDDDLTDGYPSGKITSRTVWVERKKKVEDSPSMDLTAVDGTVQSKRRNSEAPTIKQLSLNLEEFRIVVYTVSSRLFVLVLSNY